MKQLSPWRPSVLLVKGQLDKLCSPQSPLLASPLDGIDFVTNRALTEEAIHFCKRFGIWPVPMKKGSFYRKILNLGSAVQVQLDPWNRSRPRTKIHINPSKGCLSPQQVLDWLEFLVGSAGGVFVTHCDYKLDLQISGQACKAMLYSPKHKVVNDSYTGTLILGKAPDAQTVCYDKGMELGIGSFARVERKIPYEPRSLSASALLANLTQSNPFNGVFLISEDPAKIAASQRVIADPLCIRVLKSVPNGRRATLIKNLILTGKAVQLGDIYAADIALWVNNGSNVTNIALVSTYLGPIKAPLAI